MQNLTRRYKPAMVPTSQEGGNLVQGNLAELAMTAPGSPPVTPLPGAVSWAGRDNLPGPMSTNATPIPVSSPRPQPRPGYGSRPASWQETPDTDDQPDPNPKWKQL